VAAQVISPCDPVQSIRTETQLAPIWRDGHGKHHSLSVTADTALFTSSIDPASAVRVVSSTSSRQHAFEWERVRHLKQRSRRAGAERRLRRDFDRHDPPIGRKIVEFSTVFAPLD
jgi:hypothetical protein